ncbi:MAG: PP2C family protein-serine/threonine phosphatase [Terriglobales bacterium]
MNEISTRLSCFELWGGNRGADHPVELPGLAGWVHAAPLDPASRGGDVHYFSVCSKGMVSRIAVADVAGHGRPASSMAVKLRHALKRHTDHWDQSALMRELNEAFLGASVDSQYATATVLSFYFQTGELLFSSAGHPPPLWYRAREKSWHLLQDCTPFAVDIEGLPLGLIPGTVYSQTAVRLGADDMLVLYTDGITETKDPFGNELGQGGLLELARRLAIEPPVAVSRALMSSAQVFRGDGPRYDDETLVVLRRVM